jgi:acetyl-CoA acetyltransferase
VTGVSIVGVGLSRFGRQPGISGRQLALVAIRNVQAAYGGSDSSGLADTLVSDLGLTGIPFTNVKNGCATGGSALVAGYQAISSGAADIVLAVGFDKHPRGAFDPMPADWGLADEIGQAGLMVTTQFFATKIQRYLYENGLSAETLGLVAEKAYLHGSLNSNAWRREPVRAEVIQASEMVSDPLTKEVPPWCSRAAI